MAEKSRYNLLLWRPRISIIFESAPRKSMSDPPSETTPMPLTLKITTPHKDVLGPESTRVFSVHGGSVGRAADNEWVLPDPDRYMSAHHALIDYKSGCYYLTDTSTNGVFVNDSDEPVGKGTPIRLYDGDRLRMGGYQFLVSIVNVSRDGTNDTGIFIAEDDAGDGTASERRPEATVHPELRGVDFDEFATPGKRQLFEVLEPDDAPTLEVPGPDEGVDATVGVTVDPTAVTHPGLRQGPGGLDTAVQLLAEATGIDPDLIPVGGQKKFLTTVGHLVRVASQGLLDVMRSRTAVKSQLHLAQTSEQPRENNPLKIAADVEDALDKLLFYKGIHYLPAVDAFEGAFLDIRAHQHAVVVAMQAAFADLLRRFDPEALEDRFSKALRPGALLGMSNKVKYWDLYGEFYQSVESGSAASFDDVVGEVFIAAYEAEIRRLTGDASAPAIPSD
jgi:type VI secretion system protein